MRTKIYNQEVNKRKIAIEHVFGSLKTFKILAGVIEIEVKGLV